MDYYSIPVIRRESSIEVGLVVVSRRKISITLLIKFVKKENETKRSWPERRANLCYLPRAGG